MGCLFILREAGLLSIEYGILYIHTYVGRNTAFKSLKFVLLFVQGQLDITPVIIPGSIEKGRFGFALANVGDLNADGHEGE